jgi:hypothetical protein
MTKAEKEIDAYRDATGVYLSALRAYTDAVEEDYRTALLELDGLSQGEPVDLYESARAALRREAAGKRERAAVERVHEAKIAAIAAILEDR